MLTTEWLMNYDQPMLVLGVFGMIVSAVVTGIDANTRSESSADSYDYQAAFRRMPKAILAFIASGALFATGWALPNPEKPLTFQSVYEDCTWHNGTNPDVIKACMVVAKETVAAQTTKK